MLILSKSLQVQPTFYCFESYYIQRTLDCNSVLFILMHISCMKFGKAGKTMAKFQMILLSYTVMSIWENSPYLPQGKLRSKWDTTPTQVSSDHQLHEHAQHHNPRISFLLGGEQDIQHKEVYIQLRTTQSFEIFFLIFFGAWHFEKHEWVRNLKWITCC